jgi:hypothetical protein
LPGEQPPAKIDRTTEPPPEVPPVANYTRRWCRECGEHTELWRDRSPAPRADVLVLVTLLVCIGTHPKPRYDTTARLSLNPKRRSGGTTSWTRVGEAELVRMTVGLNPHIAYRYHACVGTAHSFEEIVMTWFRSGRTVFSLDQIASIDEKSNDPTRCTVRLASGEKISLRGRGYAKLKEHLGTTVMLDDDIQHGL